MHKADPLREITAQEKDNLRLAAHAALARTDLLAYNTLIDPTYQVTPHVSLLAEKLQAVERGDIKRLAVIMPPRHSKSESTSGKFPAWCLGRDPKRSVMITSYAATLAETFAMQNRDVIASNPYWPLVFPGVHLSATNKGREKWALQGARESVIAAGVGGSITGLGAWLLLIDDPVKNYEEATSLARQEAIYNWYLTTARTRLTPDGRVIIIMTRWAEDDLLGKILTSDEGHLWDVLHLPALSYGLPQEYEDLYPSEEQRSKVLEQIPTTAFPDPLGRPKDEPLWPDRFDYDFMVDQRLVMGHDFEALYQGNPSKPEGNKFKRSWHRGITEQVLAAINAKPIVRIRSYDLAWSEKQRADNTASVRATLYQIPKPDLDAITDQYAKSYLKNVALPPVILVIEDVSVWKLEWDQGYERIIGLALEDADRYTLIVEAIASQNTGFKSLRKDKRLWKHTVLPITTDKDKEARAKYALKLGAMGAVLHLYPNPTTPPEWEKPFLDELGQFPNGKYDDQVDAFTQLVNHLQPQIDRLLLNYRPAQWITTFIQPALPGGPLRTDLPQEFQPNPTEGSDVFDRMSWVH